MVLGTSDVKVQEPDHLPEFPIRGSELGYYVSYAVGAVSIVFNLVNIKSNRTGEDFPTTRLNGRGVGDRRKEGRLLLLGRYFFEMSRGVKEFLLLEEDREVENMRQGTWQYLFFFKILLDK